MLRVYVFDAVEGRTPDCSHYRPSARVVRSETENVSSGHVVSRSTIDGHAATLTDESWERRCTWQDSAGLQREVCSLAHPGGFLSGTTLRRIATSLH